MDHRAGRHGHVLAGDESLGPLDRLLQQGAAQVLGRVAEPAHEVHAAALEGRPLHLGIAGDEVRGREDVEELAADEIEKLQVMPAGAVHIPGRLVPPPFGGKVGFSLQRERPLLPGGIAKAPILRQCVRVGMAIRGASRAPAGQRGELGRGPHRRRADLPLPSRGDAEMDRPVEPRLGQAHRREAARHLCDESMRRAVDRIFQPGGFGRWQFDGLRRLGRRRALVRRLDDPDLPSPPDGRHSVIPP